MSELHEYTLKGATRIKLIIWICIISYFIDGKAVIGLPRLTARGAARIINICA
ncbi:hypothetical protein [Desulfovibrio sp. ZJ200]|uniref:hypothetical protein n=1 Tax=Desulfovibrio sp. ZJ200 TaxID=2709792 RepID=UPI001981FEE7|nr:hypothetical protein [Desulfovibrio sp. ZJ200]